MKARYLFVIGVITLMFLSACSDTSGQAKRTTPATVQKPTTVTGACGSTETQATEGLYIQNGLSASDFNDCVSSGHGERCCPTAYGYVKAWDVSLNPPHYCMVCNLPNRQLPKDPNAATTASAAQTTDTLACGSTFKETGECSGSCPSGQECILIVESKACLCNPIGQNPSATLTTTHTQKTCTKSSECGAGNHCKADGLCYDPYERAVIVT